MAVPPEDSSFRVLTSYCGTTLTISQVQEIRQDSGFKRHAHRVYPTPESEPKLDQVVVQQHVWTSRMWTCETREEVSGRAKGRSPSVLSCA